MHIRLNVFSIHGSSYSPGPAVPLGRPPSQPESQLAPLLRSAAVLSLRMMKPPQSLLSQSCLSSQPRLVHLLRWQMCLPQLILQLQGLQPVHLLGGRLLSCHQQLSQCCPAEHCWQSTKLSLAECLCTRVLLCARDSAQTVRLSHIL